MEAVSVATGTGREPNRGITVFVQPPRGFKHAQINVTRPTPEWAGQRDNFRVVRRTMAGCVEEREKDEASKCILRSASVSLLTSGGGGRLLKSPPAVTRARLTLTREKLEYRDEQQQQQQPQSTTGFLLEDLVGVDVRDLPPPHDKNACQMNVHFFPKRVERKKTVRRMKVLGLCLDGGETFAENRAEASKWKEDIKLYSHHIRSRVLHNVSVEGETQLVYNYSSKTVRVSKTFCRGGCGGACPATAEAPAGADQPSQWAGQGSAGVPGTSAASL